MQGAALDVVSWGSNRLDIVGLAQADSGMRHKAWAGGWHPSQEGWDGPGRAVFRRAPVVAAWGPDRLDIFGVGHRRDEPPGSQMLHKAWANSDWHPSPGWEALGGQFNSAPAVASWGSGRLDVFALGAENQMLHRAWANGAWTPGWEALGGRFNSAPAVAAWGPNRLDVFALGADNQMFHKAWDGRWHPSPADWEALGGRFNSAPAVAAWGHNRLDVFALGADNQMLHKAWDGRWHPWEALGGPLAIP